MLLAENVNSDEVHPGPEIFRQAVDLTVLASYEKVQLDGEPDLIVELIDLYRDDAPRRVAVMQESLAKKNLPSVKREAHSLRGSSGNLGALHMALICAEIEGIESGDQFASIAELLRYSN
jgi:HPt (histidine-containing phosphotransfer) domain-containing protein